MAKCSQCEGTGIINKFSHIEEGKCFKCNGTGKTDSNFSVDMFGVNHLVKLEKKLETVSKEYFTAKETAEKTMLNFASGNMNALEVAEILNNLNLTTLEKSYNNLIEKIEKEKGL